MLDRARTDLRAARYLEREGFLNQAVSRAYYATFYAAEAALGALGETRTKHSGVHSAFGRRVVKEGGLDRDIGRLLPRLFDLRNDADYLAEPIDPERARQALADAERFVTAVESWLAEHKDPST